MDTQSLLESFGYFVVFACVFIESGVLLGIILPLPGFSLLFTAGVFAAGGKMDVVAISIVGSLAAILGYVAGYFTGSKYGRKLFYEKATSKYFTRKQGEATERFMKKYGYSTLIIGRFLPAVHSIAPLLSGVARTPLVPFMLVNIIGGVTWAISSTLLGYYIGQSVPNAQYYILPFIIGSVVLVNTPVGKRMLAKFSRKMESM